MEGFGYSLVAVAIGIGAADWVAVARHARRAEYALKPVALVTLIAGAVALGADETASRLWLTLTALALSLAGDVFLMVPKDLFVPGLASFLVAHLAYVAALNPTPPPRLALAVAIVVVGSVSLAVFVRIHDGLVRSGHRALTVPVAAYVAALSATVVSATVTFGRPDWSTGSAALVLAGSALFYASDGLIGWTRVVGPAPGGRVAIMVAYHVGQALLVLGLLG